jgi:uncharacterized alkaline shock family protein YloU
MDKSNLPAEVRESIQEIGSISYANEVIAIIAGVAASEIDGVASMGTASSIADILSRNRRPVTKGVRVEVGSEEASVDIVLSVEYGKPIQRVCRDVQDSVRKAIETMTGLHVVKVDVHVLGVSFEKETQAIAQGASVSELGAGSQVTETVRRGQPIKARRDEPKDKQKKYEAPEFVDEPEEVISKDVDEDVAQNASAEVSVAPDKEEAVSEEPETANALPKPVELDGQEDAVFASVSVADIPQEESEYNTSEDAEDFTIDDTALI